MIDRYVTDAIHSTGTRGPLPSPLRERVARGSEAPFVRVEIVDPLWTDADEEITAVYARPPSAT